MIRVEHLTKYYGTLLALDDVSFEVGKGEIVGLLGPNAAGKTTIMRILTGYLMPTKGDVWIAGRDVGRESLEARKRVGYLPETIPLYADMSVRGYLKFVSRLRGVPRTRIPARIEEVVGVCHLEDYADALIAKLSRGYRQRVGVAQAIVHDPDVLVLDEPTVGIDPRQVAMTRELIRELGNDRTILLSSHILPEISMTCRRVIIIDRGRIIAEDSIENLSARMKGGKRLVLEVEGPSEAVGEVLRAIGGVRQVSSDGIRHLVDCAPDRDPRGLITEALLRNGWTLLGLSVEEMSLEDIFLRLTPEEPRV